jgi:prevent-host-death family protein
MRHSDNIPVYWEPEGGLAVTKRMSVRDARANFSDLIGSVYYTKEPVIIERKGKPAAVVISPEQYERYEQQVMERFERALDELHRRNADKDPDEVLRDVTEIVEEVRQERYDRRQQSATGQDHR